jgi:beta-galactosidase
MAFTHNLIRGIKGGQPFWLMEQTPSTTACRDVNPLKRPGALRLWSWQAVAHGADAVLFFQMRAGRGASEKYHGAVIGHAGRDDTRVFREVAELGAELARAGDAVLGGRTPARVAILFDWDSWWALELSDGPSRLVRYQEVVRAYHRAVWAVVGAGVDVVPVTADLAGYDVVVAPVLHMVKGDLAGRLEEVARRGGTVLTTFLSGRVDEDDNAFLADVPGPLADLMGIRVDEWDARPAGVVNPVDFGDLRAEGSLVFEIVIPRGAATVATYRDDFYAGTPAVTRNVFGAGEGWYVATALDQTGVDRVVRQVLDRHALRGPYAGVPGLEAAERVTPDGRRVTFLLHHGDSPVEVRAHADAQNLLTGAAMGEGELLRLEPCDVLILTQ